MALEKDIAKAIWDYIEPRLDRKLQALEKRIQKNGSGEPGERLITMKETAARLGVNLNTVRDLAAAGELLVKSPNGRNRIIESSIDAYIRKPAG